MAKHPVSRRTSYDKAKNPARNAAAIQAYADSFLTRCAALHRRMTLASARLESADPDAEVTLITSMLDKYLDQMESRVQSQFVEKVELAVNKAQARKTANIIRRIREHQAPG